MRYWVIESPTRGYYKGFDEGKYDGVWKPQWAREKLATHEDVWKAYNQIHAEAECQKVQASVPNARLKVLTL